MAAVRLHLHLPGSVTIATRSQRPAKAITSPEGWALLGPDRFFALEPGQLRVAHELHDTIADLQPAKE